ncbi:CrcB family protein [Glaciihabitans arcticus]|uniref:Fluoride-specific ion channel FluC n=1 Tax=Glaciihabitans arcticus TaxID=2668039 RepID=A0A4Q9GYX3_9MICO|nr:CrcB family protein [Glaciihabitans arcticus]TBN58013.1 CrcB family protein [Glaciihabitans arcticus]
MTIVLVLLAGAFGAALRYGASLVSARWFVLAVNVVGSLLAGIAVATLEGDARLVVVTGFCGGLTTFSTFSVETVQQVLDGKAGAAASGILLNLVLGVGACAAGYALFA